VSGRLFPQTHAHLFEPPIEYTADSIAPVLVMCRLGAALEALDKRVAVVISSDLAHTHLASGPYGKSAAAEPFDLAVGEWGKTLAPAPLLETARSLVPKALSCGYTGLVMLHGMMASVGTWSPLRSPFCLAHPTYYGMMVAAFNRTA